MIRREDKDKQAALERDHRDRGLKYEVPLGFGKAGRVDVREGTS